MLYTVEDAIQIYHAKSSTLEFFAAKVPKAAWQGIRKADIEPAKEYYSDDIIVDFDLLDRAAYEEKSAAVRIAIFLMRLSPYLSLSRNCRNKNFMHKNDLAKPDAYKGRFFIYIFGICYMGNVLYAAV